MFQAEGGQPLVEERISGILGQSGVGIHVLILSLDLMVQGSPPQSPQLPSPLPKFSLYDLGGTVRMAFPKTSGQWQLVGRAVPEFFHTIDSQPNTFQQSVQLQLVLDRAQLDAIEALRNGGDVMLDLTLYGEIKTGMNHRRVRSNNSVMFRANISTWIETLEQMGYGSMLVLQVPVSDAGTSSSEVVKHLQSAESALLHGHYRDAVGACRDALESLAAVIGIDDIDPAVKEFFQTSKAMDKVQRLKVLRRALKLLCHPARHVDDVTATFTWDREDAVAVVAMVAALIPATLRASRT